MGGNRDITRQTPKSKWIQQIVTSGQDGDHQVNFTLIIGPGQPGLAYKKKLKF